MDSGNRLMRRSEELPLIKGLNIGRRWISSFLWQQKSLRQFMKGQHASLKAKRASWAYYFQYIQIACRKWCIGHHLDSCILISGKTTTSSSVGFGDIKQQLGKLPKKRPSRLRHPSILSGSFFEAFQHSFRKTLYMFWPNIQNCFGWNFL